MGSKKLERLMERDIPERDIGILRSLVNLADDYGTGDAQDLPYELREAIGSTNSSTIASTAAVPMEGFKIMALLCGLGKPIEGDAEEETILELSDAGKIAIGDPVLFKFGRKEVQRGSSRASREIGGPCESSRSATAKCAACRSAIAFRIRRASPQDLTPASAKKVDEDVKAGKENRVGRRRKPSRRQSASVLTFTPGSRKTTTTFSSSRKSWPIRTSSDADEPLNGARYLVELGRRSGRVDARFGLCARGQKCIDFGLSRFYNGELLPNERVVWKWSF